MILLLDIYLNFLIHRLTTVNLVSAVEEIMPPVIDTCNPQPLNVSLKD